jgi:FkbM family methyltransferase
MKKIIKKIIGLTATKYLFELQMFFYKIYYEKKWGKKIFIRPKTTDSQMFSQIFKKKEYSFNWPIKNPRFILDCGANVGYASIWFSNVFPNCKIVAIEPDSKNFDILKKNVEGYPNVFPLKGAIWKENCFLQIKDIGLGECGYVVEKTSVKSSNTIKAYNIKDILEMFGEEKIDILKIDIEGSEKEVFSKNTSWIDSFKILVIEIHDNIKKGCSEAVKNKITKDKFIEERNGENQIFIRK